jgi:hypothetical protein
MTAPRWFTYSALALLLVADAAVLVALIAIAR